MKRVDWVLFSWYDMAHVQVIWSCMLIYGWIWYLLFFYAYTTVRVPYIASVQCKLPQCLSCMFTIQFFSSLILKKWICKVYHLEYTFMSQIIIHIYIYTYLIINFRNFIDDVGSEIDKTRQKFGIMNAQQTELPPGEFSVLYDSCKSSDHKVMFSYMVV